MSVAIWAATIGLGYTAGGGFWSGVAFTLTGMIAGMVYWRQP